MAGISELERQDEEKKSKKLLTPEEVVTMFTNLLRSVEWIAKKKQEQQSK